MSTLKYDEKYLIFTVNKQKFAIIVHSVDQIFIPQKITKIPQTPDYITGLTNLRGIIINIINISILLDMEPITDLTNKPCIVFIYKDDYYSLLVSDIYDVEEIEKLYIQPIPANINKNWRNISENIINEKELIVIIDINKIPGAITNQYAIDQSTEKLSPQPHNDLTLGLLNTKPDLISVDS